MGAEQPNSRRCPRCPDADLHLTDYVVEKVDVCPDCSGMYFDSGELEGLNQLVGDFFAVKLDEPEIENIPAAERNFKPTCPGCGEEMLPNQVGQVWVDQCPKCQGLWVDEGEVGALRVSQLLIRQNMNLFLRLAQ